MLHETSLVWLRSISASVCRYSSAYYKFSWGNRHTTSSVNFSHICQDYLYVARSWWLKRLNNQDFKVLDGSKPNNIWNDNDANLKLPTISIFTHLKATYCHKQLSRLHVLSSTHVLGWMNFTIGASPKLTWWCKHNNLFELYYIFPF